jgi:hypothetical protein
MPVDHEYQKVNVKQWNCSYIYGFQAARQREMQGNQWTE